MIERNRKRRAVAMVSAAAVSVAALMGAGSAAFAAPGDVPEFGNIDGDRAGSLTIHKFLHQKTPVTGDISEAPAVGDFTDPVEGVVFTAYPLLKGGAGIDLSDPAAWDDLAGLTPGAACTAPTGYTLGSAMVFPATDAEGMADLALSVGVYQVCETFAPANIIDRAAPFIVTIPMPYEGGWVYDVNAFPKNGEGLIEKSIEAQDGTGLGAVVKFPVTAPIPTTNDTWTGFAIRDTLDVRLTPVASADMAVTVDGAPLDASYYTVDVTGQQITMNFTAAGLAWLNDGPNAQAGKTIQVVFAGTVTSLGNGTITNQAELWPNNPGFDPAVNPPIPSNEVKTNWGSLAVQKRAAGSTGVDGLLEGAVFSVYNALDPYAADCSAAEATGDPLAVDGETEFTSDGTGVISIPGLFVSDSVNPAINALQRCYVLEEVAAPAGYVLPTNPFTAVTVKTGENTVSDNVEIQNTQQEVPELPLTGANGQLILIVGGTAAIAIAVGLVLMNRRRQAADV